MCLSSTDQQLHVQCTCSVHISVHVHTSTNCTKHNSTDKIHCKFTREPQIYRRVDNQIIRKVDNLIIVCCVSGIINSVIINE